MPAPDICYLLDGSMECGHIAVDAYKYLMHISPTANADVDAYDALVTPRFDRHMDNLVDQCVWLEGLYCQRRVENPLIGPIVSIISARHVIPYMAQMAKEFATGTLNDGHLSLTAKALDRAEHWYFSKGKAHLRRSMNRCLHDLSGKNMAAIEAMADEHRRALLPDLDRLREQMGINPPKPKVMTQGERKALRRSTEFLSKMVGPETVRVFMTGQEIKIAGDRFVYGVTRTGGNMGHGSSKLLVYSKADPDLRLFNLCIYTKGVPVADHVSSIIMAIRAGDEDDVLRTGNVYDMCCADHHSLKDADIQALLYPPRSLDQVMPWVDGLPDTFGERVCLIGRGLPPCYRKPDRRARIEGLTRDYMRLIIRDMRPELKSFNSEFRHLIHGQTAPRLAAFCH